MVKWEEIEEQLKEEDLMVYGLVETHLRDTKQPPCNPDYVWEKYNRTEGSRKQSGIGAFFRKKANWQRIREECREHSWLNWALAGEQVLLGFVYLRTGVNAKEEYSKM